MAEPDNREHAEAHKYPKIVAFVRETPWAILETKLAEIRQMLTLHVRGQKLTEEEIQARIGAGPARRDAFQTSGSVAVIPIYGVIMPKADLMTEMSGGTSIERLQQSLRAAMNDEKVKSILFDVNSPGGSVALLNEMAAEIRAARRVKPVVAVANTMAASAAYQLASQASEFVVTPSGSVGSIGTLAAHEDISKMEEMAGVKTTLVSAGKFKTEGNPFEPLGEEAKAEIQRTVDKYYGMFVQDVARGRGITVEKVRADYGQGRMLLARDALAAGMVDRVDTFDNVLASMEKNGGTAAPSGALALGSGLANASSNFQGFVMPAEPPAGTSATDTDTPEAAFSGLSFADEADALRDSADRFTERTTSLAEVERGHLTVTKRDRLTACTEALRESLTVLDEVLAATAPVNHKAALLVERQRLMQSERSRLEGAQK